MSGSGGAGLRLPSHPKTTPCPVLADLAPTTVAVMHGSSFHGDGAAAMRAPAAPYDG